MSTAPGDSPTRPAPGLLRRFAAIGYDSLLMMALALAYGGLATGLKILLQGPPPVGEAIQWGPWRYLVFLGLVAVLVGFHSYFWHKSGQTLGMRAWRLKLTDQAGGPVGWGQCLLRALLAPLSLACLGLGYFWLWIDRDRRTLHGRLSGTRVMVVPKDAERVDAKP